MPQVLRRGVGSNAARVSASVCRVARQRQASTRILLVVVNNSTCCCCQQRQQQQCHQQHVFSVRPEQRHRAVWLNHIVAVSKVSEFMRQRVASELGTAPKRRRGFTQSGPKRRCTTKSPLEPRRKRCSWESVGYGMYSGDHYANTRVQSPAATLPAEPIIEKVVQTALRPSKSRYAAHLLQEVVHRRRRQTSTTPSPLGVFR